MALLPREGIAFDTDESCLRPVLPACLTLHERVRSNAGTFCIFSSFTGTVGGECTRIRHRVGNAQFNSFCSAIENRRHFRTGYRRAEQECSRVPERQLSLHSNSSYPPLPCPKQLSPIDHLAPSYTASNSSSLPTKRPESLTRNGSPRGLTGLGILL